MNRRDFIGSVVAGMTVSQAGKAALRTSPNTIVPLRKAHWIQNGLITAGGLHEPYIFVLRRGGESPAARNLHDLNQRDALIRKLQDQWRVRALREKRKPDFRKYAK